MYCSSCGVALAQGLSYCNYCGAKLSAAKGGNGIEASEIRHRSLVFGMLAVFVFGLVSIMGLMTVMKVVLDLDVSSILAFTLLSFLIMLLIEGVFIRLLLRLHRGVEGGGDETVLSKRQATKEIDAAQVRGLPEPVPSVTEGTTRTFEPVYNERTPK